MIPHPPNLLLLTVAASALAAGVLSSTSRGEDTPATVVEPGTLLRWPGSGVTACRIGERTWAPLEGGCVFPVDLLAGRGGFTLKRTRNGAQEQLQVRVAEYPYSVQRLEIEDESKVSLSDEDLKRVKRESREIRALWSQDSTGTVRLPLHPPLQPLPEGGRFGARRIINGQPRNPHTGVDYSVTRGTPVYAAGRGTAALVDNHFFAGNSIFVDHGHGLITMYFHLEEMLVDEGAHVERGQQIATVGSSGRATGPHLHFGVRWHAQRVNPELLFRSVSDIPALIP